MSDDLAEASAEPSALSRLSATDHAIPPALSLLRSRALAEEADAALAKPDEAARREACEAFLAENPSHPKGAALLDAMIEAQVKAGDPAAPAVAAMVLRRVAHPATTTEDLHRLLRQHFLAHRAPAKGGLELIRHLRARIDEDAARLGDGDDYETAAARLALVDQRVEVALAEARLLVAADQADAALDQLAAAEALLADLGPLMLDARGERVRVLPSMRAATIQLVRAAALRRRGDEAAAKEALVRGRGLAGESALTELYRELSIELGVAEPPIATVIGDPQPAGDFTLNSLRGPPVKLASYRGKALIMTFWATWCEPCKMEMKALAPLVAGRNDVALLAVNTEGEKARETVAAFLAREGLDVPVAFVGPEPLDGYAYTSIPSLYLVDRQGRIVSSSTGYGADLANKLTKELDALAEGREGGREVLDLERAPAGWTIRHQLRTHLQLQGVALLPDRIWATSYQQLVGWDATGAQLPAPTAIEGFAQGIRVADLEGDGAPELVILKWSGVEVRDAGGALYWASDHHGLKSPTTGRVGEARTGRLVALEDRRMRAWGAFPEPLWGAGPFPASAERLVVGGDGVILLQDGATLFEIDASGRVLAANRTFAGGHQLVGRLVDADGRSLTLATSAGEARSIELVDDLDGDHRDELVITGGGGAIAVTLAGEELLRLRTHDAAIEAISTGDLDGEGGGEMAAAISNFGIVVLGKSATDPA